MKKAISVILSMVLVVLLLASCKKSEFARDYKDPSKINTTQIGQQYTGAIQKILSYVMPGYTRYFTVEQPWIAPFTQSIGKVRSTGMYKIGTNAAGDRWSAYYNFLAQYREFQRVYNALSPSERKDDSIFYITAAIFMYDQTEKAVDLWGDIPWTEAGYVGQYGNDYLKALAKFDSGEGIYTTMLDSLKYFADQLASISVPTSVQLIFRDQDFINFGNIDAWRRYCNSLRLRMLMRVSGVDAFQQRAANGIQAILSDPEKYPLVLTNDENIQVNVLNSSGAFAAKEAEGWNQGIGSSGWNLDIASKSMIDFMNANADPRRRVLFERNSSGVYRGLDDSWATVQQTDSINTGAISIYNRTTFDDNLYYPGVLITASEVNFILAEYYLGKDGYKSAEAKSYYDNGVEQSIKFHFAMQALSKNNSRGGTAAPLTPAEISAYLLENDVNWDNALDDADALRKIAYQKWIHFNIVQNIQNWSEYRRLGLPVLVFPDDVSGTQKRPPLRFPYSTSEASLNAANYEQVKNNDNLNTRVFWDVQ
jgi:hypothetical protein